MATKRFPIDMEVLKALRPMTNHATFAEVLAAMPGHTQHVVRAALKRLEENKFILPRPTKSHRSIRISTIGRSELDKQPTLEEV